MTLDNTFVFCVWDFSEECWIYITKSTRQTALENVHLIGWFHWLCFESDPRYKVKKGSGVFFLQHVASAPQSANEIQSLQKSRCETGSQCDLLQVERIGHQHYPRMCLSLVATHKHMGNRSKKSLLWHSLYHGLERCLERCLSGSECFLFFQRTWACS